MRKEEKKKKGVKGSNMIINKPDTCMKYQIIICFNGKDLKEKGRKKKKWKDTKIDR